MAWFEISCAFLDKTPGAWLNYTKRMKNERIEKIQNSGLNCTLPIVNSDLISIGKF